jgi:hypothetical protein
MVVIESLACEACGMKRRLVVSPITAVLIGEAMAIIDRADLEQRDLSEFESGRVDAFLQLADVMASMRLKRKKVLTPDQHFGFHGA